MVISVREFFLVCGVRGLEERIADSKTGEFEMVDGEEHAGALYGLRQGGFGGWVPKTVVYEDFGGEFVVVFLRGAIGEGGHFLLSWVAVVFAVLAGFGGGL
jgi:hypothetical protein